MYYLISFLIYIFIVVLFVIYLKKPDKNEKRQFKGTFTKEMMKGLTNSDVRSRKKRVKVLPFFQRFLYWLWFSSLITMIILPTVVLCIARYYIIDLCFVPENAFCIDLNSPSMLVFGAGVFFAGIPLLVAYSYLTNRGIIRKADLLYQLGSFQEYSKKTNIFISGILLIIGFPLMILGFNSYRYFNDEQIIIKSALSINETVYSYSDVNYIEHRFYSDDTSDYSIIIKNGETLTLYEDISLNQKFVKTINDNSIEIKINHIKPFWE
ncbi:MAG: hypothetical protein RBQ97_12060 [Acholeplasma sp.]|nr:hypothetical protein [Acholeplasma sp.]